MSEGMINQNTILKPAEAGIEAKLPANVKPNYEKIVAAGMKLAMDKGPEGIMASIKNSEDPVTDIVKGAVNIVLVMRKGARGTMPPEAMIPAMFVLMLHALDFAERAGVLKVDNAVLDEATQLFADFSLNSMGLSPEKVKSMTDQVQGVSKDPAAMEKIKQYQATQEGGNVTA